MKIGFHLFTPPNGGGIVAGAIRVELIVAGVLEPLQTHGITTLH